MTAEITRDFETNELLNIKIKNDAYTILYEQNEGRTELPTGISPSRRPR